MFMINKTMVFIFSFVLGLSAAPLKQAKVKTRGAFVYQNIFSDSEILFMLRKGEIATLMEKKVDENDDLWYKVSNTAGDLGWIKSENLALGQASNTAKQNPEKKTISRRNSKERRAYVKAHPKLDRRFKKFIRDGFVGIGMNEENVLAALGEPDLKKTVFLLDHGKIPVWIYNPNDPTVILFEKNRVKGWSKE